VLKKRGTLLQILAAVLLVVFGVPGVARAADGGPTLRETVLNYLYGYANGRTISGMHHKAEVGGAGMQTIAIADTQPVQYVKIYTWERATVYGYSLWSLGVYG
jgi:hypothetical protein